MTVLCAVSQMSFCNYMIGNIGLLPCDIPVIYIGASMKDISQVGQGGSSLKPVNIIIMAVGLVVVIIIIGLISFYAN